MKLLENKVALITGASRGIGKSIAEELYSQGATISVTYKENSARAEQVMDIDPTKKSGIYELDVSSITSIRALVEQVKNRYGQIDILVNNAGINKPNDFDKISDDDWDEVLSTNLKGPFMLCRECLPLLKDKTSSIINISSVSGQYGGPRTTHYAVSKSGLLTLTQNLAIFCASRQIRVNAVSPGLIESEMAGAAKGLGVEEKILLKRMGKSSEVAQTVAFLASDMASYITAQTINVNGGLYF